ncbi:M43 family zinc metalloprotease [Chitinophaga caeni]|uniref:M43 family zinc metalloprotease n=1 Tax=Chitinophaga caeni TaxID=2029983 RepID=UPI0018E0B5E0|nr:M43 family zinc metalloprotease [Chitinophaga caeni]
MRFINILFICCTACSLSLSAQRKCGTAEDLERQFQARPSLKIAFDKQELAIQKQLAQIKLLKANGKSPVVTIPVVVHIVLPNPALVTDAQVYSQIEQLNKDYSATNADISKVPTVWQPIIGDIGLQFCLAQRTPEDAPTTGITRTVTSATGFSINDAASAVKHGATGGTEAWNTENYLNIWVCQLRDDYLGVATPPGGFYPDDEQGVVITYSGFGNTGSAAAPYNLGRTTTHEIGHFFSLRHTWGDDNGACTTDDGVNDTPLQGAENYGCPTFPLTDNCSPTAPGVMFMNYMDYVNDACMYLFTAGQSDRMRIALDGERASLKTSNGCIPVNLQANDAAITAIKQPPVSICGPTSSPLVTLTNKGTLNLTSAIIRYRINGGTEISQEWTGNLSSFQSTDITLASFNVQPGTHLITAYPASVNGGNDENHANDTSNLSFVYHGITTFPLNEGFEGNFPPTDWTIVNPDKSYTWQLANVGNNSNQSVMIQNYLYNKNDEPDDLLSPVFDGNNTDSIFVVFDIAAAVTTSLNVSNNPWDTLSLWITTDCGQTFIPTGYKKWGPNLVTRKTASGSNFVPTASDWRTDTVDLTPYTRNTQFRLVFRNTTNYENNIYLDNINIFTKEVNPYLKEKGILLIPNPFRQMFDIVFYEIPENLENVAVYDVAGRQIMLKSAGDLVNNKITFDLVNAPNGLYFVKLFYTNKVTTYKLVKVQ